MKAPFFFITVALAAILTAVLSFDTGTFRSSDHRSIVVKLPDSDMTEATIMVSDSVPPPIPIFSNYAPHSSQNQPVPSTGNRDEIPGTPMLTLSYTSMKELGSTQLPPLDAGMVNVTGGRGSVAGYRLGFHPDNFSVSVPYNPELLPQGYTKDDILTYFYDTEHQRWTAIDRDSVDSEALLIVSRYTPWGKALPEKDPMNGTQDALRQSLSMMSPFLPSDGGGETPIDFINAILKTPEMPETSAFTPTSIKELEAANPLAGTQRIQPPTANASGTANISYPIEIPQGRQGMQPNLALTYSSGGGNGWLGVGWDISVPSITVETRWGVPRYDYQKESDTYVYEGEQLVTRDGNGEFRKLPHRTNQWTSRLNGNVQFFPRKNEAFDSIVRHGNSPNSYWWSVTHKNGVTDYYGKYASDNTVNNSCVLRNDPYNNAGAIAHWALAESVDPYGNSVKYFYNVVNDTGIEGGTELGKQIYLSSIRYTNFHDSDTESDGKYSVRFHRKDGRTDVAISANRGFKEVTADELCYVEILYDTMAIRYYMFYTENNRASQFKTRLTDVVRIDTIDEAPWCQISENFLKKLHFKGTRTHFDYYDAPEPEDIFGEARTYTLPDDDIHSTFISQGFNGQEGHATALGGTNGKSWSLGGTASVGVGFDVCMTTLSVGGNFDYSRSQSEGALTLIDLDGDGLADKVFKDGKKIYYRKRLPYADGLAFSSTRYEIAGMEDFLQETSNTTTWGLQASAGCSFSGSWPTTKSSTNTYFADVNADGLPDLITEDGVLFNTTQRGGNVTFTPYYHILESQPNPNDSLPIVINSSLPCEDFIFDGAVSDSIACGIEWVFVRYDEFKREDSVSYRTFAIILDSLLNTGEYTARYEYYPEDSASHNVSALHPNKIWLYRKMVVCEPQPLDPDMDAVKVWVAQKTGRIEIASTIRLLPDTTESRRQSKLVDGVRYTIQYDSLPHLDNDTLRCDTSREIFSQAIGKDDTLPHSHIDTVSVTEGDFIFFRLQSQGSRAFDLVDWQREIRYINTTSGTDQYGLNDNLYSSSGDFTVSGPHYFQAHKNGSRADIDVHIKTGNIGTNATLWVLYPIAGSYAILPFSIVSNQNQHIPLITSFPDRSDSIRFYVFSNGGTNWGEVEIRPHIRYRYVEDINNTDTIDYYPPVEFPYNNYKNTVLDSLEHSLFGPLYRGWGQFAYNNNADENSAITDLIDISTLFVEPIRVSGNPADTSSIYNVPSVDANSSQVDVTASYDAQGMYHPLSKNTRWVEMQPESRYWSWVGFGNINYMMRDTVSNTRLPRLVCDTATSDIPEYDHPVPQPITISGGVEINPKTVRKQNVSKLRNYSLSIGVPIVPISTGTSWSNGDNRILTDYMDLNGDRYPDVVGEVNVQYSMPWGGIGQVQPLTQHVMGISNSATTSTGTTYGASYSIPTRGASNTPRNSKISFDGQGSLSASLGGGSDYTSYNFMDMNGDGLPDKVTADGLVALNTGYSFLPYENWNSRVLRNGQSENTSLSIGLGSINISQASISGGVGVNMSENNTTTSLVDFNGDGLPDIVSKVGSGVRVSYNLGNGQWAAEEIVPGPANISYGTSYSESANAGVTVGFTLFGFLKITVGVQTSPYNRTFSKDRMQLTDINGDGYPDIVTSDSENSMRVRYNQSGKTNLLRSVTDFTGSIVKIDYTLSEQAFEKPQRSWTMSSVLTDDPNSPLPGAHTLTDFTYEDPHYDRNERMDYGFRKVTTKEYDTDHGDILYRYTEEEYENRIFNKRGRKTRDCIYDAAHRPYVEHLYDAVMYDYAGSQVSDDSCARSDVYVAKESAITNYYEGMSTPQITTAVMYVYDSHRNVVEYTQCGDTTHHDEYFRAEITYATGMGNNLVALPIGIEVRDVNDTLIQKRTAEYNTFGKLSKLTQFNKAILSEYVFSYDRYGNLSRTTLPQNAMGQRLEFSYKYETTVNTYPERISNLSLGYSSDAEYDYRFGKPTKTTDINGNQMIYQYDYAGRNTVILAPYEIDYGIPYTIRMEYFPRNYGHWDIFDANVLHSYAYTSHYDRQHPANPIRTTLLCDGLGRMLQTKKDAEVNGSEVSLVTGRSVYDCFGRTVAQYHPFAEPLGTENVYNDSVTTGTETVTKYDVLNRQIKIILPTTETTTMAYGFGNQNSKTYFKTVTTDAMGNSVVSLTGTIGQQILMADPYQHTTRFIYDPLGRLLQSSDPDSIDTRYEYDMLGQLVWRHHPDAGDDRYSYDPSGNLIGHTNTLGDTIRYTYHYNQLTDITFPRYPINNVHYTYGTSANANINAAGKVMEQHDASGFRMFQYGKLGEVMRDVRTFVVACHPVESYTFRMDFNYDSWNRIQSIVYPDEEKVSYAYNTGGMLKSISSTKRSVTHSYIDSIWYNKFEQKSVQWNGNGTHTHYSYDTLLRLSNLVSVTSLNEVMQEITYTYDAVSNITQIVNGAGILNDGMGGRYENTYQYDSLYRLTHSEGAWYGRDTVQYQMNMAYLPNGRIHRKNLNASVYTQTQTSTTNKPVVYDNYYNYGNVSQPNTVTSIGQDQVFSWTATGNLLSHTIGGDGARYHCWDESNRLLGIAETKEMSLYLYDAGGERFFKVSGKLKAMNVNGEWSNYFALDDATLYASPYVVVTHKGYTKHYYADNERIASRIGGGGLGQIALPLNDPDPNNASNKIPIQGALISTHFEEVAYCLNVSSAKVSNSLHNIYEYKDSLHPELDCYWYHPDHLGSSSWITGSSGKPVEHLHYLPWGENFVHQRNTNFQARYTFSAKEKDEITGYSYFGARYYNSDLSIWLSVDPMDDKYPSTSPYTYCANNPVRLVDEDGEEWVDIDGNKITDHSKIKVYIFYDPESFSSQTKQMYKDAVKKYGEGSVALSNVTTTAEFIQDWSDMSSDDIREVNLNYHGSSRTINLDYKTSQYLTSTGDGKTPCGNPAINIEDLPVPSGNIQNAQLNINSCQSNGLVPKGSMTIAQAFRENTLFYSIRVTEKKVNYWNWLSPNRPHPEDNSDWDYLRRTDTPQHIGTGVGLPPK